MFLIASKMNIRPNTLWELEDLFTLMEVLNNESKNYPKVDFYSVIMFIEALINGVDYNGIGKDVPKALYSTEPKEIIYLLGSDNIPARYIAKWLIQFIPKK
jgi:hypothetical protein